MTKLDPDAPVVVRLAALGQHLERWTVPRSEYPEGRTGYRTWRSGLSRMHAARSGEILREVGYDDATAQRVGELLTKKRLKSDAEVGLLEDAICLTFLELQLADFADGRDPDQVVQILQKTWDKMTPRGHAAAQALAPQLAQPAQRLLARASGIGVDSRRSWPSCWSTTPRSLNVRISRTPFRSSSSNPTRFRASAARTASGSSPAST